MVLGWGEVAEGLMGPPCVVVVDPCPHGEAGMGDGGEAARPAQLLLEGLDEALV